MRHRAYLPLFFLLICGPAFGLDPMTEYRFCKEVPDRDERGHILRRADVLQAFKNLYPCPATGSSRGRCPGWDIDHVIPLANGGCDAVFNLQWLPGEIKTCPGTLCKDRFERRIYLRPASEPKP